MGVKPAGNSQPQIDIAEHEYSIDPPTKRVLVYGYDGSAKQILKVDSEGELISSSGAMAVSIQTSGTDTFIGEALPGTALATAAWKAYQVDEDGNITWADGDANFDNVATDLTSLSYS
jgi:hypothetical protein